MQVVILVLLILIIGMFAPPGFMIVKNYLEFPSRINNYVIKVCICFGFGIIYDLLRLIPLIFFIPIDPFVDQFAFCAKMFLFLLGIYFEFQILFIFLKNAGHQIKHEEIVRALFLTFALVFGTLCIPFSFRSSPDLIGIYGYQLNATVFLIMFLILIPVMFYAIIQSKSLIEKVKDKKTNNKFILAVILFAGITLEGLNTLRPSIILNFYYLNIIFDLSILLGIIIAGTIAIIKYPDLMDATNEYFNINSIYIIKNNGDLLYSYELLEDNPEDAYSPRKLLLGGFIFAISQGVEEALKVDKRISSINLGKGTHNLIIKYGKYTIGVLFIKEASPLFEDKLMKFINNFEILHKHELENWRGKIADIREEDLKIFIKDLFR